MALSRINEIRKNMVSKAETDNEIQHILHATDEELFREYVQNCTDKELREIMPAATAQTESVSVSNIQIAAYNPDDHICHIKGTCSIVLNNCFMVRGIRIMDGENGLFVAYPNDPFFKGDDFRSLCQPITRATRELIENAILEAYQAKVATI